MVSKQGDSLTTDATVQVVTCATTRTVAVSLGRTLHVAQYSEGFTQTTRYAKWTSPEDDDIRAVSFLTGNNKHASLSALGPVLAVAGDLKMVKLVAPFSAAANGENDKMVLSSYGPHVKKIQVLTHVPTSAASIKTLGADGKKTIIDSFLLADKFGDVFLHSARLTEDCSSIEWCPEEPSFSLQHLSIFTTLAMVPGSTKSSARVITCDRDNHVRVNRYPDTFYVDNYLWGPRPQMNVAHIATSPVMKDKKDEVIVALGGGCGGVSFWQLDPTSLQTADADSNKKPLEQFLGSVAAQEARGPCAGIVWLGKTQGGSQGAFCAAFEHSHFIHGFIGTEEKEALELDEEDGEVVALVPMGDAAVILQRSGQVTLLSLGGCNHPTLTKVAKGNDLLVKALAEESVAQMLAQVDIQGLWKSTAATDPRTKKDDGEDEEDNKDQIAKRARSPTA